MEVSLPAAVERPRTFLFPAKSEASEIVAEAAGKGKKAKRQGAELAAAGAPSPAHIWSRRGSVRCICSFIDPHSGSRLAIYLFMPPLISDLRVPS